MPDAQDYLATTGLIPGVALGMPGSDQTPPPQQAQPQAPQTPSMAGVRPPLLPALPQYQNIPQAPRQDFADPIKAFQNPAVVLATLGSLLTRSPLTTAMNAGGAAMEAFHKGDMQTAELKRKEWDDAAKQAEAQNKLELEKYKEAWHRRDVDIQERFADMVGLAAGFDDPLIRAAIQTHNIPVLEKLLIAKETVQNQMERDRQIMKERLAEAIIRSQGRGAAQAQKQQQQQQQLDSIVNQIDRVQQIIKKHPDTAVVGIGGMLNRAGEFLSGGSDFGEFEQLVRSIQTQVPRALTGVGRISAAERKNIDTIVPGLGVMRNTQQVYNELEALKKILQRKDLIEPEVQSDPLEGMTNDQIIEELKRRGEL